MTVIPDHRVTRDRNFDIVRAGVEARVGRASSSFMASRLAVMGAGGAVMGQPPLEIDRAAGVERAVAAAQRLGEGGYRRTEATIRALLAEAVLASNPAEPNPQPCGRRNR